MIYLTAGLFVTGLICGACDSSEMSMFIASKVVAVIFMCLAIAVGKHIKE